MEKIDLCKDLIDFYSASSKHIKFLELPPFNYLMIDGQGDPNTSQEYRDSVQALYSLAYALKFAIKKGPLSFDFKVMPLEGLWWMDDMRLFSVERKTEWKWTMMILQPLFITTQMVETMQPEIARKKGMPLVKQVRFESYAEDHCAQILHIGPYSNEAPTITSLHKSIADHSLQRKGKHHEIYLNTPLKTSPDRLKTIIRQPVCKQ